MKFYLIIYCMLCAIASSFLGAMVIPYDDPVDDHMLILKMVEHDLSFRRARVTLGKVKTQLIPISVSYPESQTKATGIMSLKEQANEKMNLELEEDCVVCLEPYDMQTRLRIDIVCDKERKEIKHSICKACLLGWQLKKQESLCPTCRRTIDIDEVITPSLFKRFVKLFSLVGCFSCPQSE